MLGISTTIKRYGQSINCTVDTKFYFLHNPILFAICARTFGALGSVVVKALCYKPEGRGFEIR
jgi:hypothetical protein